MIAAPNTDPATPALPPPSPFLAPQLQSIETELEEARLRARRLAGNLDPELWAVRPGPERWSIGEQIAHLNLTSRGYLPRMRVALRNAKQRGLTGAGPFRRDFMGWLLCKMAEPPVRIRVKTTAPFIPLDLDTPEATMREFDQLQDELIDVLDYANGLALDRIDFVSPFDSRIHYNLYSCLRVLPVHQRHHLWLGEKIREGLAGRYAPE
jgi:hypothetical protein